MKLWDLNRNRLQLVKGRSCVATSMEQLMFWLQYGKNFLRKPEDVRLDLNLAQKQQFQSHEQSAAGCSRSHLFTPEHHILPHPVRFQHTAELDRKLPSWHKQQTWVGDRRWRDDTFLTRVCSSDTPRCWNSFRSQKRCLSLQIRVLLSLRHRRSPFMEFMLILLWNSAALLHPHSQALVKLVVWRWESLLLLMGIISTLKKTLVSTWLQFHRSLFFRTLLSL